MEEKEEFASLDLNGGVDWASLPDTYSIGNDMRIVSGTIKTDKNLTSNDSTLFNNFEQK